MDEYGDIQFTERNADHRRPTTASQVYPPGYGPGQPVRTVYLQPRPVQQMQALPPQVVFAPQASATIFGKMTTGQLIDVIAQIFAALMPLPTAPVATSDAPTDVGNLILYQSSLAQYAKRDEQVRTLGNLITKLVG
jgi:hypothetical protein